jgi:UDP-N-acetylmuramoylalanine--D-glutamate ligase
MNVDYRGRRATIMGLGHFGGGVAAARWLARLGAVVTVTDLADETALADSLALLADVPIAAFHLDGHREEDFRGAELVVVNPAVRPDSPWLPVARRAGARLATELELFVENCPALIVGVTGSNGKSTTAAMIASILKSAGRRTFLGGNLGGSLLDQLPQIGRDDWVVLELSSFQLWHFAPTAPMPHVAVVTSCSPNHLDWHASYADYVAAKQRMLVGQTSADFAVLNTLDAEVASWARLIRGRLIAVGASTIKPRPVVAPRNATGGRGFVGATGGRGFMVDDVPPLCVPGEHNRINAACAAAAAMAAGCQGDAIRRGLEQFRGLPQRLEWFATIEGRRFYNDSAATTPESTIAALRSLDMPVWLLAGGKSKGFDFASLAAEIGWRASGAAFFGTAGEELRLRATTQARQFPCIAVETMEKALRWCWLRSRPAEAIVLSPACASTDQFRNFQRRGRRFAALVERLANPLNR